jgi:hypothetical protein
MYRYLTISLVALLAIFLIVPVASARPRVVVRGHFGSGFYGPAWYGWYGPAWYSPFAYGYYNYEPGPATGSIKLDTKAKSAAVYVDGGYAGTVKEVGTLKLRPGNHDIELRDPSGKTFFQQRVDVMPGKTLKLTP